MKTLEITGKNVEEAIEKALIQLDTTKDKVEIEVIEKGCKGFLNILGTKLAKIKVTLKKDFQKEAREFLENVLKSMNIEATIDIKETEDNLYINLNGNDMGILIGYRGETLDALQYLVSLSVNKGMEEGYKRITLDTEGYRKKREETLIRLADKLAKKVKNYGKTVKLEPMNPYERRIIHSELQDNPYVKTYSEGDEPFRRVVIELKKKA
ncbi:RNA-binding cell elongation regulator Jag/EloR [Hathewaya limosa]|uniref:RNA-binding protein KhpB n=1 Tax=Hathewaya limosa TaxID=1536 RepID=A0ABU0JNT6_HATLI|nr:RNA-binding cell elongation regulator Jag/EloR [Hathewaya limosa]AWZ49879.1 protein jag [Clostridiaceae bacterium 14S0207]MDQ0478742.1 spoIIIJ-associated protein [Hathewaya limosa]